ncbi:MAG TPA: alpha-amylase family glycosyl hydrolase [Edaphobacter sp.]|nr:alpha-amylase family glycosyl hydrolase [Edaphobacter sp.]
MIQTSVLAALLAASLITSPAASHAQQVASERDTASSHLINGYEPKWWKEAVVYQIYPRSFQDSNGDGIGDLKGITQHLDYLQKLGVNVIWLSPTSPPPTPTTATTSATTAPSWPTSTPCSPASSNVTCASSSTSSPTTPPTSTNGLSNPAAPKTTPTVTSTSGAPAKLTPTANWHRPTNYRSVFSGSAWQFDPKTNEYYLHYFAVKQPDLNWDNPKVRQEVFSIMHFWLDKGVDGFRMDVIPIISKQPGMPTSPPSSSKMNSPSSPPGPIATSTSSR